MVFKRKSSKVKGDLNNDGKFDKEDKSLAASVLATKIPVEEEEENLPTEEEVDELPAEKEDKVEGKIAAVDINPQLRKGNVVPEALIAKWKECGIDYSKFLEK